MEKPGVKTQLSEALAHHQAGNFVAARKGYERLLVASPDLSAAWHLLGLLDHQEGKLAAAVSRLTRAVELSARNACYWNSLGMLHADMGRPDAALACFQQAVSLAPTDAESHNHLGLALQGQGRLTEALHCYRKAITLDPRFAEAHNNMGYVLNEKGGYEEAKRFCLQALSLNPELRGAFNNLGIALLGCGMPAESIPVFERALQLGAADPLTLNNLGNAYKGLGRSEEAISCYHRAIDIKPDFSGAYHNLYRLLQESCAWEEMASLGPVFDDLTTREIAAGVKCGESPFVNITRHADPELNLAVARSWSQAVTRGASAETLGLSVAGRDFKTEKITVGYLSGDFRDHPVAHLVHGLFGLHDRKRFRVHAYSYGPPDGSFYRDRIAADADAFVDIRSLGNAEAARRIHRDGVDILVDLTGFTKDNRMEILAFRPAPVQVNYLGYPGTSGGDFMDYFITDRLSSPEGADRYFTEKLVYLPDCFQVNSHGRERPLPPPPKRAPLGLPKEAFVFCSFNQAYKIEPVLFKVWMSILTEIDQGVLWLAGQPGLAERNLRAAAAACGVEPDRLLFAPKVPGKADHLRRLQAADLGLDTRIYNGHTTTSDTLWAGVPVIALTGNHFASRVSTGLLTAVGLSELVTTDLDGYRSLAVALARSPEKLAALREKLRLNRETTPLFNTPLFIHHLEAAFEGMWRRVAAGKAPTPLYSGLDF